MTTLIEAARQALEAFEWNYNTDLDNIPACEQWAKMLKQNIISLRQAIEQAEKQEPVAWIGLDLDNMVEAFDRVIEEHHLRKNPFHDPVNRYAMLALRELRGLIAYMKRNTTPPSRQPEQEPVAWVFQHEETGRTMCVDSQQLEWGFEQGNPRLKKIAPLYTSPPPRQPLTDEQWQEIAAVTGCLRIEKRGRDAIMRILDEAAHGIKEKNNGNG